MATALSNREPSHRAPAESAGPSVVRHLPLPDNDASLVAAVRAQRPGATEALFDRHSTHVRRVLVRVLGADPDIQDLIHDVFVVALCSIDRLDEPTAVRAWLTSIAVHTARSLIRKRARRRVIALVLPLTARRTAPVAAPEVTESLRATYRVLDRLDSDERICFALRFIDGMELTQIAAATGVSLATVKRRLGRAQQHFVEQAQREPGLAEWIEAGRWRAP